VLPRCPAYASSSGLGKSCGLHLLVCWLALIPSPSVRDTTGNWQQFSESCSSQLAATSTHTAGLTRSQSMRMLRCRHTAATCSSVAALSKAQQHCLAKRCTCLLTQHLTGRLSGLGSVWVCQPYNNAATTAIHVVQPVQLHGNPLSSPQHNNHATSAMSPSSTLLKQTSNVSGTPHSCWPHGACCTPAVSLTHTHTHLCSKADAGRARLVSGMTVPTLLVCLE
jgi:hypothetical protein